MLSLPHKIKIDKMSDYGGGGDDENSYDAEFDDIEEEDIDIEAEGEGKDNEDADNEHQLEGKTSFLCFRQK